MVKAFAGSTAMDAVTSTINLVHSLAERARLESAADRELLAEFVARRDSAAFATIVERHGPMILRLCRRLIGDPHLAEDAFQATFLILARKAASLQAPDRLANWLFGTARKVALITSQLRPWPVAQPWVVLSPSVDPLA
jgi:hypothetical protein